MAKYDQFSAIFGSLRRCWSRHPRRRAILEAATHPTEVGVRGGKRIVCAECGDHHASGGIAVDHIDPVVPLDRARRDMAWEEIIERMFNCPDSNLQALCKECHSLKTKWENKERKVHANTKRSG